MLAAFHRVGIDAELTAPSDAYTLELGSRYTSGLGKLAGPFMRTAWRASVISDILEKLRLMIRPYEVDQGITDRWYQGSLGQLRTTVECAPLRPQAQLQALRGTLDGCRRTLGLVATRRLPRPLIGIVGEIFCRLTPFSNQDLIRRLEEAGGEAWLSGFCEWVHYAASEQQRQLKLRGRGFSRQMLSAWITAQVQKLDERALSSDTRFAADQSFSPARTKASVARANRRERSEPRGRRFRNCSRRVLYSSAVSISVSTGSMKWCEMWLPLKITRSECSVADLSARSLRTQVPNSL